MYGQSIETVPELETLDETSYTQNGLLNKTRRHMLQCKFRFLNLNVGLQGNFILRFFHNFFGV